MVCKRLTPLVPRIHAWTHAGVRVVDAAVMLDVVHTNTNMPIRTVAARAANVIKEGHCIPAAARGDQTSTP